MTDAMMTSKLSRAAGLLQDIAETLARYPVSERTPEEQQRLSGIIWDIGFECSLLADDLLSTAMPDCPLTHYGDQEGHCRCSVA